MKPVIVAVDGPAGSGKSTVAKLVAKRLKIPYLDTGAMYRALTFLALDQGIPLSNGKKLAVLARKADLEFKSSASGQNRVFVNGREVTKAIRTPELTQQVHHIASKPEVRARMVNLQRRIASKRGGAVEGRDIGTVVFPKTPYKFYLDADFEMRVSRRFKELKAKGLKVKRSDLQKDQKERDLRDFSRKVGPLKIAKDATVVDTTKLTIPQVVGRITQSVRERQRTNAR